MRKFSKEGSLQSKVYHLVEKESVANQLEQLGKMEELRDLIVHVYRRGIYVYSVMNGKVMPEHNWNNLADAIDTRIKSGLPPQLD